MLSWLFKEFPDPDPSASPHSLGEKREPPSPLSQLGDADPASRPRLSPAAGVGGEGLPRGAGALAVASSPRGSHPSPGRPQWRWGDLARVFLRVTRSRSAALRVPPGKAAADTSRRRACARLSPASRGVHAGDPASFCVEKGEKSPFIPMMDLVTYIRAWGKIRKEQNAFRDSTAGKHVAAVADINNSLGIGSGAPPGTGKPCCKAGRLRRSLAKAWVFAPERVTGKRPPGLLLLRLGISARRASEGAACTVPPTPGQAEEAAASLQQ